MKMIKKERFRGYLASNFDIRRILFSDGFLVNIKIKWKINI